MKAAEDPCVRARRGWLALFTLLVVVAALAAVDLALKRAPHAGFVLPGADYTLTARDFPGAWARFERSATFRRIQADAPAVYQRIGVQSRRETGVRWTPRRWSLWFGRPMNVSVASGEWAMSCRPGLLLCGANAIGALGPSAWRDGFLLIGSAQSTVDALAADGVQAAVPEQRDAIRFAWATDAGGDITLQFNGEWHVSGSIALARNDHAARDAVSRRVDTWPGAPAVSLFVSRYALLEELFPDRDWPQFPMREELQAAWDEFRARLPRDWHSESDSIQFALESVDTRGVVPVPALGVVVRSAAPFAPLVAPPSAIPYQWGATQGWMAPWLGEPASLYAAASSRLRVFTNQEPAMARLLDRPLPGRIVSYDAHLKADFAQLGSIAKTIVRTAADQELLPGYNKNDVESDVIPLLSAVQALGRFEVEGRQIDSRLEFVGTLTAPERETESE